MIKSGKSGNTASVSSEYLTEVLRTVCLADKARGKRANAVNFSCWQIPYLIQHLPFERPRWALEFRAGLGALGGGGRGTVQGSLQKPGKYARQLSAKRNLKAN